MTKPKKSNNSFAKLLDRALKGDAEADAILRIGLTNKNPHRLKQEIL